MIAISCHLQQLVQSHTLSVDHIQLVRQYRCQPALLLHIKLSAKRNETETKQLKNSFKTVLFQFHFGVWTVLLSYFSATNYYCYNCLQLIAEWLSH